MVAKLGAICARYRWVVVVLWILLLAGMAVRAGYERLSWQRHA